jgi:hypothetical protein
VPVSLGVDGHIDRPEDLSLWTARLHVVRHDGDRPQLKTGLVPSYLYLPGNDIAWLPVIPNTGVTLQPYADVPFRLPAGSKPDSLKLSIKIASLSAPVIDLLAYNVRTGVWDRLGSLGGNSQTTNFVGSIPNPANYTGPAGDVTMRLLSTTGTTTISLRSVDLGLNEP